MDLREIVARENRTREARRIQVEDVPLDEPREDPRLARRGRLHEADDQQLREAVVARLVMRLPVHRGHQGRDERDAVVELLLQRRRVTTEGDGRQPDREIALDELASQRTMRAGVDAAAGRHRPAAEVPLALGDLERGEVVPCRGVAQGAQMGCQGTQHRIGHVAESRRAVEEHRSHVAPSLRTTALRSYRYYSAHRPFDWLSRGHFAAGYAG